VFDKYQIRDKGEDNYSLSDKVIQNRQMKTVNLLKDIKFKRSVISFTSTVFLYIPLLDRSYLNLLRKIVNYYYGMTKNFL
jgi:hypothetical protein